MNTKLFSGEKTKDFTIEATCKSRLLSSGEEIYYAMGYADGLYDAVESFINSLGNAFFWGWKIKNICTGSVTRLTFTGKEGDVCELQKLRQAVCKMENMFIEHYKLIELKQELEMENNTYQTPVMTKEAQIKHTIQKLNIDVL